MPKPYIIPQDNEAHLFLWKGRPLLLNGTQTQLMTWELRKIKRRIPCEDLCSLFEQALFEDARSSIQYQQQQEVALGD